MPTGKGKSFRLLVLRGGVWCLGVACIVFPVAFAEPVRDIEDIAARLNAAAAHCDALSLDALGDVHYDDFSAPFWLVHLEPSGPPSRRVLLTGGVHGDEPAGCEAALRFVEESAVSPNRYSGVAVDVIPLVNPWGWAHDKRANGARIDLNRDFASYAAQESRLVHAFVQGTIYDLVLDLHEDGGAKGFYLYQIDNEEKALCRHIIALIREQGYPIARNARMLFLQSRNGIIDAPGWTLWTAQFLHQLSLTNYCRLTKSERVFLFETPSRMPMEDRVTMHRIALHALLETVAH
ncbi:MAG TPA: DUF2817 domain-containing protein [Candidatus Hydrogenedentes bacterium]|nr:DUF2817 domain-containing protein [Candidatus Hydrogenedentota bacterium]